MIFIKQTDTAVAYIVVQKSSLVQQRLSLLLLLFKFCTVVRQQIWGGVVEVDLTQSFSAVHLSMQQWKNY